MIMKIDSEPSPDQILQALDNSAWQNLAGAINQARAYLQATSPSNELSRQIEIKLTELVNHQKWEVRKGVAEALGYGTLPMVMGSLQVLTEDDIPYVQQSAKKSLREVKRVITKISEKRDPTAERLFALIKKMNPRNVREAYAAALQVGQIYYRELAAVTTHELRNYLRIIFDQLDNIEETLRPHPDQSATGYINKAKFTMQELIEVIDRLAFLSKDSGPVEVFEVMPVIEEAIYEARAEVRQDGHECKDVRCIGQQNVIRLKGDRIQLKVALRNLIINAIEASPSDEVVDITLDVDRDSLNICVLDRGSGMTEQEITSSFKHFTTTKKESDGMGLGVPIAQKVIYFDFGGEIRYESEIGKGTRVLIELPIYKENTL